MKMRALWILPAFASLLLLPMNAQEPPAAGERPKMPPPKNLKLLKPEELMPTMQFFKASLGVNCHFCHVDRDFASDENPHKNVARQMITMAREINTKFGDGKTHVTCFTCHRGAPEPLTAPPSAPPTAAVAPAGF